MHKLWIFFLEKKAFTYLVIFSLVLVGIYSIYLIPKESSPEVVIPIGVVSTVLRGGSAEDVEKLVTNKLEQEIANVENIDKVTSSSNEGISVITAQFLANADLDQSIQALKDAVDKVKGELPDDATEPNVMKVNFSDQPVLIVSVSQDLAPKEMTKLGDDLEREIKKVKGVSSVDITGTRKREVQVVLFKDKLASYGISVTQVIGAIQSANASAPIGRITMDGVDYPIKFEGSIDEATQVPDITLQATNGASIYLRDVAFVVDGLESPKTYSRISVDGKPSENALTLSVHKKSGGDVNQVTTAVLNKIEELKKPGEMLSGANTVVSVNRGADVQRDLRELTRTGFETVFLVMLILFLTIGWRESIVAGLSIPLSFVIAFIGIYLSGNTINFLSLFSLILAIGILVDSGIVVAEAIHTRMKKYGNVKQAAVESIKEYAWPLIAGTMTTVAVFFPLFFLSGIVGKFVKSIPFTIIFVLIASIFVALGMVPILATLLIKNRDEKNEKNLENSTESKIEAIQEKYFHKTQEWYKKFLGNILLNRKLQNKFLLTLLLAFVGSICLVVFGLVKVEMFPQDDQPFVVVSIEKPEGTPLANTDLVVRQVEEILYNNKNVKSFVTTVGAGTSLMTSFNGSGGGSNTKIANITVMLGDKNGRELTSTDITNILRKELSVINDATITVGQGNNGPPSGKPVVIKFIGDDLNELTEASNISENILNNIEGTQDVSSSVKDDGTQLEIYVDRSKAAQYGLSAAQVAQILRTSVSGVAATTIKKQSEDIDVLVKVALNENFINPEDTIKTSLESIKNMPVTTAGGNIILLGSVLETNISPSRASIAHEGQKRIVTLGSNLKTNANALDIVSKFKEHIKSEIDSGKISKNISIDYGGENEDIKNTFRDMTIALVAGLALMLAILVLEFNSFRYSFYLLMAVPLSAIGVFGGLAITGKTFSFSAMLGFIALAGVIINHAIILLDSILHKLDREEIDQLADKKEDKLFDIIVEASAIRLRPIVLTTITTVVGMIPLAGVSALWGPLAISIMFGLLFAMVLTLLLIPMFFYRYPGKRYKHLK